MNTSRGTIANLQVRSNLLSDDFPRELARVSAFELHDINRRNRLLPFEHGPLALEGVTPAQHRQWTARLFWGDRVVALTEERRLRWLEAEAAGVAAVVLDDDRPLGEEAAFEALYVLEDLGRSASPDAAWAREVAGIVRDALAAGPLEYSDEAIDRRLAQIRG